MANDFFRFKEFEVRHQDCAMKVNTDGCLLGGWATAIAPKNILDIGAGSGVIALMMAQKFALAQVDAVEIDPNCATQCQANFVASSFANRLQSHQVAIQNFKTTTKYNLIASNPPYFAHDLQNPNAAKAKARHQISLTSEDLFFQVSRLLSPEGVFCVIIPIQILKNALICAAKNGLFLQKEMVVQSLPKKPIGRYLLQFGFEEVEINKEEMCIYDTPSNYSQRFIGLLKPFYLNL